MIYIGRIVINSNLGLFWFVNPRLLISTSGVICLNAQRLREIPALAVTPDYHVECEGNVCVSFSRVKRVCQVTMVHQGKEAPSAQSGCQENKEMLDLKDNQSARTINSKFNWLPSLYSDLTFTFVCLTGRSWRKGASRGVGSVWTKGTDSYGLRSLKVAYMSLLNEDWMYKLSRTLPSSNNNINTIIILNKDTGNLAGNVP